MRAALPLRRVATYHRTEDRGASEGGGLERWRAGGWRGAEAGGMVVTGEHSADSIGGDPATWEAACRRADDLRCEAVGWEAARQAASWGADADLVNIRATSSLWDY